jgi:glycine cleavage system H lipoate-binding protein/TusA-related sulfurtransferase
LKIDFCKFPDNLLYDVESGLWAESRPEAVRIGITSLISWTAGAFYNVTFKSEGTSLRRGQVGGSTEGPKHFDVVRVPVSGVIVTTNTKLLEAPSLLNKDPYGAGWFMELRPTDERELSLLQSLPEAEEEIAGRIRELHVHCFEEFPDYEMFEIGTECSAVLVKLNELLSQNSSGTVIHLVSDDNTAPVEMHRWSDQTGNKVLETKVEGNLYHFIAKKR